MDTDQPTLRISRRDLVMTGASTVGLVALGAAGLGSKFIRPQALVAQPLGGGEAIAATPGCRRHAADL